jgi:hypothetical protein
MASAKLSPNNPLADKLPALTNRIYSSQEFGSSVRFQNVPQCPQTESFFHYIGGGFLG